MSSLTTWRIIPDTDNKYEVSDSGRVRRVFYGKDGSVTKRRELNPVKERRMLRVWIKRYGKRAYFCVHRLVAEAFIPGFDLFNLSMRVEHRDGDMYNNNISNLIIA